jgi:hypothetical protein
MRAKLVRFVGVLRPRCRRLGTVARGPDTRCAAGRPLLCLALVVIASSCAPPAGPLAGDVPTDNEGTEQVAADALPSLILAVDLPDRDVVVRAARLWDVSEERAALRLRMQDADPALRLDLAARFPEVFVELKIGSRGEHVYVLAGDAGELRTAITEVYGDAGVGPEHLVFEQVLFTNAELRAREEEATLVIAQQAARHGVRQWSVDVDARTGLVDVEIDERNPAFREAVQAELEHEVRFTVTGAIEPA